MYFIQQFYRQYFLCCKLSLEGNNPELSFGSLEKNENSGEPRSSEDANTLHTRAERLVQGIDTTLGGASQRTQQLSFQLGETGQAQTPGEDVRVTGDFPIGQEGGEREEVSSPDLRSMGEEVSRHPQKDTDLGGVEENKDATETAEEQRKMEEVLAEAQELALELGYTDFLAEVEGEGILEGKTPEEVEAILNERIAALEAEKARIAAELANPALDPAARQALESRSAAIDMMQGAFGSGGPGGGVGSINGGPGGSFYSGGVGISPEDIERYGPMGGQLATWLQQEGFPVYNGQPSMCGQNVGEAMNAFYTANGMNNLQVTERPRHGFKWAEIMAGRSSQFQKIECSAEEAPAGALISYQAGPGGSAAYADYGHIEIALGQGKGYYFGTVANSPGGSKRPPVAGEYVVYMPIGGNPGESPSGNPGALTA